MMKNSVSPIFSQTFETPLELFSLVIESDCSPWRKHNYLPEQYSHLLSLLPNTDLEHPVKYVPDFPSPLVPQQHYYVKLIQNAFYTYLNQLLQSIDDTTPEVERAYRIQTIFRSEITQKLSDTKEAFSRQNLAAVTLPDDYKHIRAPQPKNIEAYILNVLKFHLIAILLNVQDLFPEYFLHIAHSASDIHEIHFLAPLAEGLFKKPVFDKKHLKATKAQKEQQPAFEPIMADLGDRNEGPLPFQAVVEKQYLLQKVERHLYESGLLTDDYLLTETSKKFVKPEFAQCILEMIQRGVFRKTAEVKKAGKQQVIKIAPSKVLAFFNARYKTNLTDQFNGLKRKDPKYTTFLEARGPHIARVFDR